MPESDCIIPLTKGYQTVVDDVDADLSQLKWCVHIENNRPYALRHVRPTQLYIHKVILARKISRPLEQGEKVDHVDNDSLNNRRDNLRLATHAENMRNRKLPKNNTSGFKGVTKSNSTLHPWRASIKVNGETIDLGYFSTAEEASDAYVEASKKHHGEFARTE